MRYPRAVPSKKYALLAVALVAIAIAGWWGWGEHDKRSQRADIEAAVADTTARLRDSLAVAPNAMGKGALPVTESLAERVLSLPMYPELPIEHVERVAEIV